MRYELRLNNGVFHVFDTVWYTAIDAFPKHQQEQATKRVATLNSR